MKGFMKLLLWLVSIFKVSCYIETLFTKNQFELTRPKFYPQTEQMKGLMKELLWLDWTFKASCFIAILFTKNGLNRQGQNSIHKQRKWKASWRNSFCLDSTFKTSCYIEILFTKNPVLIAKAKILFTNRANERGLMKELLWLDSTFKASCLIAILFTKKQFEWTRLKFYLQTEQMKGLMKEVFLTWFNLQS